MEHVIIDDDLAPILRACTDEDLIPIRDYILKASTNELDIKDSYEAHPDRPSTYVNDLVYEIRTFGGNTLLNFFRGDGVPYAEVARDVASKVGAKYNKNARVEEIERAILTKILEKAIEDMSPEERVQLEQIFRDAGVDGVDLSAGFPLGLIMAQVGIRAAGFVAYQVAVIVANAVAKTLLGRGLSFAATATLTRTIGLFAGPIGWIITGVWAAIDITGPAYRVTIPCVCHVAYLRLKNQYSGMKFEGEI